MEPYRVAACGQGHWATPGVSFAGQDSRPLRYGCGVEPFRIPVPLALGIAMYPTEAVPPSHQIRISPEKSEFDAKGVVVWWLVDGESLQRVGAVGARCFLEACLLRAATLRNR